jgi:hypothetical protein
VLLCTSDEFLRRRNLSPSTSRKAPRSRSGGSFSLAKRMAFAACAQHLCPDAERFVGPGKEKLGLDAEIKERQRWRVDWARSTVDLNAAALPIALTLTTVISHSNDQLPDAGHHKMPSSIRKVVLLYNLTGNCRHRQTRRLGHANLHYR